MNRISKLSLIAAIGLTLACELPTVSAIKRNDNNSPLTNGSYHTTNNNHDPWYMIENAPCGFRVNNDGVNTSLSFLFINSAQADVYSGVFDATGTVLLWSTHNGIYAPGSHSVTVSWPSSLDAKIFVAGGFVNSVLYRSDNCGLF